MRDPVTLRALLDQAQARGLTTLPPFIAVSLVHRLCQALQRPQDREAGEVVLERVQVGFDGAVLVPVTGGAERDVAAAALILDQLLDETIDAELTRIIGEARRAEPLITTALGLEQRLGHWLVKQRQLFPKHELVSALLAWLFPAGNPPPDEALAAWFADQCTSPPAPVVVATPEGRISWPWRFALLAGVGLAAALVLVEVTSGSDLPDPSPSTLTTPGRRLPVIAPQPVTAAVAPPTTPAPPTLPRWGEGAPAQVRLSTSVHGLRLETAGFSVIAPSRPWAVKTLALKPPQAPPRYASLFVAEFDAQHTFKGLSQVGPRAGLVLSEPEARFFVLKTNKPDDGSFSLSLSKPGSAQVVRVRADVLADAMTDVEARRFVLEGLVPRLQYAVTQASGPPVVAGATVARAAVRDLTSPGFQQPGAPLDQVLLKVGEAVKVGGVSQLSFVVLTTEGAPEEFASISVNPIGPAPTRKPTGPTLMAWEQCKRVAPDPAQCEDLRPAGAVKRPAR